MGVERGRSAFMLRRRLDMFLLAGAPGLLGGTVLMLRVFAGE